MTDRRFDTLVIGAGQAGLAAGHHLTKSGRDFLIVDGAIAVGESWHRRYQSLTLFTPRWLSALPERALPGDPDGYASAGDFAAYLEDYSRYLPIQLNSQVVSLARSPSGDFLATLRSGQVAQARNVIVATGGFQRPVVPSLATAIDALHLTPETYKDPKSVTDGPILVVGDGASGRDIAFELASEVGQTSLATGKPRRLFPEHILGRSIWWWLDRLGLMRASARSWVGRKMQQADAFPDRNRSVAALKNRGVQFLPRVTGGARTTVSFADGSSRSFRTIVWCVGYRDDTAWLEIPEAVSGGTFLHNEGISPVQGLFFVGRPWQRNRASALIAGVGDDARIVVGRLR